MTTVFLLPAESFYWLGLQPLPQAQLHIAQVHRYTPDIRYTPVPTKKKKAGMYSTSRHILLGRTMIFTGRCHCSVKTKHTQRGWLLQDTPLLAAVPLPLRLFHPKAKQNLNVPNTDLRDGQLQKTCTPMGLYLYISCY